jgi:hypothetical protein
LNAALALLVIPTSMVVVVFEAESGNYFPCLPHCTKVFFFVCRLYVPDIQSSVKRFPPNVVSRAFCTGR